MVLGTGFNLGDATGRIILDASGVGAGVREAQNIFQRGLNDIGGMVAGLGREMSTIGQSMTVLTAPVAGGFVAGIRAAGEFDAAMREISARTGLVGADLQQISDFALQMGADTVFSSGQAADAFLQLLSSGQSAAEAVSTLPTVLNLAAASGDDLGRTADVVTDIMAAFNLQVSDAASVADSLARAAASSSADVSSLGQGFANVGGIARQFGLDVDQTAAILAIFSERGIKGAEAGTQLKSMLLNMSRDTGEVTSAWTELGTSMFDSEGNLRDMGVVLEEIATKLRTLDANDQIRLMQDLAGSYGIAGLAALTAGQSIEEMQAIMAQQADAAAIAQVQMGSFNNTIGSLIGSLEALAITVLTPFINDTLKPLAEQGIRIVNTVIEWAKANPELAGTLVRVLAVAAVLGPVLVVIGAALQALGPLIVGAGALIGFLLSPVGLLILGIGLLAAAWATNWENIQEKTRLVVDNIRRIIDDFNLLMFGTTSPLAGLRKQISEVFNLDVSTPVQTFGKNLGSAVAIAFARLTVDDPRVNPFTYLRLWIGEQLTIAFGDRPEPIVDQFGIRLNVALAERLPQFFGQLQSPFDMLLLHIQDALITSFGTFELSGIVDAVTRWAQTNINLIIGVILNVATIAGGGPVGAVLGIARLIATAIENDFLGFGTFIEQSGIGAAVQSGVETLRGIIENALQSLLGGGADQPLVALTGENNIAQTPEQSPILATINRLITGLRTGLESFGPEIQESIQQIGNGISGFFEAIAGADTSGFVTIAETVITSLLNQIGMVAGIAGALIGLGLDIVTDIFENVFPKIGEGIAAFLNLLTGITQGDPGLILQSIADGIGAFIGAIVGAVTGFADPLISAINDLTGVNLPLLSDILGDVKDALQEVWDKAAEMVQPILDEIQRLVDWFFDEEGGLASVVNWIHEIFVQAIATIQSVLTGIWDAVSGPLEAFKNGMQRIFNWIKTYIIDPVRTAIEGVIDALQRLAGATGEDYSVTVPASGNPNKGYQQATQATMYSGRDSGGRGYPGMAYWIGRGAQPELFVPDSAGTFYPNADRMMQRSYEINVMLPEAALAQPERAQQIGRDFGQAILDEMDSQ